jgi:hypothetical protein
MIVDPEDNEYDMNDYPEEESDLQVQFENEEDEELLGSYGGAIQEDEEE